MTEWKEVTLKDITQLVIDYRGKTPLKLGGEWSDSGYRALSAKNVKTGVIVAEESIRYVDEVLYKKWMKDEVQRGDILITSEAPFGEVFYWNSDEKIVLSQRLFDVRIKKGVCSQYVYYYMTSFPFQAELRSRASGTTVLGLKQPELLKCTIILPDYEMQVKIAEQLSEIDFKIECNRKICANLEAQAQALFKHWFIDFVPFKDGKFVESELGMIPEGWRVGRLDNICCFSGSKIKISDLSLETYYSTENMLPNKGGVTTAASLPTIETTTACFEYDVLISNIRPYFKKIFRAEKISGCSNDVMCFHPKDSKWNTLLYCILYDDKFFSYVMSGSKGTKMPRGDKKQIMKYTIIVPTDDELRSFSQIVEPMFRLVQKAKQESSRLATLRDTLLPKLMSGELEINNI